MASHVEIGVAMQRLKDAMPAPRGVDSAKAFGAYLEALGKFEPAEIDEGIRRFIAGECDAKISLKFYPRPPELARIVAGVKAERAAEAEKAKRVERLAAERAAVDEGLKLAVKTPEQIARAEELMRKFHKAMEDGRADQRAQREAAERARIRAAYGMEPEVMAGVKDRPLPKGMKQVAAAAPAIPVPALRRDDDLPFGGLG
jgi:hypothetical protein